MNRHSQVPDLVHTILKSFNSIQHGYDNSYDKIVERSYWRCEAGRFRVWTGNVGAHLTSAASLAYRLRQAESVLELFEENLRDLATTLDLVLRELSQTSGVSEGHPDPTLVRLASVNKRGSVVDNRPRNDDIETLVDLYSTSAEEEEFGGSQGLEMLSVRSVPKEGEMKPKEAQREREQFLATLYEDTANLVECLFRLTMLIRSPSRREQLLETTAEDVAFMQFDVDHVRSKYPDMDDFLIYRLGRANSKRRANLRYLQRHHEKLSVGIEEGDFDHDQRALSETIATDFKSTDLSALFSGGAMEQGDDMSVTSFATTFMNEQGRLPPRPPTASFSEPFQCTICFHIIKATNVAMWAKHVFTDLQPYTCLSGTCEYPTTLFENRRDWRAHQMECHSGEPVEMSPCAFCHAILEPYRAERHVATHLQELALFSLPKHLIEDSDEVDSSLSHHDSDEIPSDRNDEATSQDSTRLSSQPSTDTEASDSEETASVGTVTWNIDPSVNETDASPVNAASTDDVEAETANVSAELNNLRIQNEPAPHTDEDNGDIQTRRQAFRSSLTVASSVADRHAVLDLSQRAAMEDPSSSMDESSATEQNRKYDSDPQQYRSTRPDTGPRGWAGGWVRRLVRRPSPPSDDEG